MENHVKSLKRIEKASSKSENGKKYQYYSKQTLKKNKQCAQQNLNCLYMCECFTWFSILCFYMPLVVHSFLIQSKSTIRFRFKKVELKADKILRFSV